MTTPDTALPDLPAPQKDGYGYGCPTHYFSAAQMRDYALAAVRAAQAAQPERKPLSDAEIETLAHRMASTYTHRTDPTSHAYGFVRHTLLDFVRAIEAAHGIGGPS